MRKIQRDVVWAIGGQSGEGIDSSGEIWAKAVHSNGLYVFAHRDFPSRIRGGFTSYHVRMSDEPLFGVRKAIDVCIVLDQESFEVLSADLAPDGLILYDEALKEPSGTPNAVAAPLSRLAKENGSAIQRNVVGLGISASIFGIPLEVLERLIRERFEGKGDEAVSSNIRCLEAGEAWWNSVRDRASVNLHRIRGIVAGGARNPPIHLLSGNDAVGLGALIGGCRFLSAYPITPATEVMYWLASNLPKVGGVVVQAEDEIAAVNMAIGASFGGMRAMTSTSGPGLSLMSEGFGLAGMTETPVVIVDVQRAGPATGMPTRTEQSNLWQSLYAAHGDMPRIVLSPSTHKECHEMTAAAFELADRFQCPVFVLSDEFIGLSLASCNLSPIQPPPARPRSGEGEAAGSAGVAVEGDGTRLFPRYKITPSGISPRPLPGTKGGVHIATSYEHDEEGFAVEDPEMRVMMMDKRMRKLASLDLSEYVRVEGAEDAEVYLAGWGSTYGPIREAFTRLGRDFRNRLPYKLGHLHFSAIAPFPRKVRRILQRTEMVIVIEGNASAQFSRYLASEAPHVRILPVLKYDGRPFTPDWVAEQLRRHLPRERDLFWELPATGGRTRRPLTDGLGLERVARRAKRPSMSGKNDEGEE